jgi:hypothetical protein
MGHEDAFAPPRLSAGCGFRKETIAGTRRKGRDAPITALCAMDRAASIKGGPWSAIGLPPHCHPAKNGAVAATSIAG